MIIAYSMSRTFSPLWEVKIKAPALIFGCFFIQVGSMYFYKETPTISLWFSILILISYLLLSVGAWLNRKLPGFKLFSLGMFMNFLVIASNGGRMPVSSKALEEANLSHYIAILESGYKKHQLMNESTIFPYLGDVIPLHLPYALMNMVVSVGDLFVTLGMCLFFILTLTEGKLFKRKRNEEAEI
jgi:hypothetical protein